MKLRDWVNPGHMINRLLELRASLQIILLLVLLFIVVATGGSLAISRMGIFSNDAYAINNMGVIRGAMQRIVKRELTHNHSDEMIADVDKTLVMIRSLYIYDSNSHPYMVKENIIEKLDSLESSWIFLKKLILEHRDDSSDHEQLLFQSELCWEKANFLTFSIQKISEKKLDNYQNLILIIAIIVSIFIFSIILIVYRIIHKHLEVDVITDQMTKLHNRSYFNQVLKEQINLSLRYDYKFSLILIDIDHFKNVNDDFGHPGGDRVLIQFSSLLKDNARDVDYVFRLGGEEFAIIAPQCSTEQAGIIAEKFRRLVSSSDFNIERPLTISLGASQFIKSETQDELFIRTDKALYQAKSSGRNSVVTA